MTSNGALAADNGVSLELQQADLGNYDWSSDAYDAIVAIFIQFAGPELRQRIFSGFAKALNPGGVLMLQGYRPEQLNYGTGGPPNSQNMYTEEMLQQAFAGWRIEHLAVHDSEIREGSGHGGMSALIDLIARRPK